MIVLSLFDGMACGYEALKRAGVPVTKYYASEVDKYAIKIAKKNHPDIVHLGDVEAWYSWDIGKPDLIIGGSPCQGFSFAGKQLNFKDPRSRLFFDMVAIIEYWKPEFYLLENVKMKKEFLKLITKYMGVKPHFINSALVSAQNRQRYYWYNWEAPDPEDRGILLQDILEEKSDHQYHTVDSLSNKKRKLGGVNLTKNGIRLYRNDRRKSSYSEIGTIATLENKSAAITASNIPKVCGDAVRGRYISGNSGSTKQGLEINFQNKANSLTCVRKDSVLALPIDFKWRNLTPIECERLQTLPDNYTGGVSDTQRYRMLGNGWTVDVLAHIFRYLPGGIA